MPTTPLRGWPYPAEYEDEYWTSINALYTAQDAEVHALYGTRTVAMGGTGQSTLTPGAYLKGAGTSAVAFQGTPIPIADGGTGAGTLPTGYLKGAGTGAITAQAVPIPVADGGTGFSSAPPGIANGRLTTESGVPVSSGDRTAQSTLYFTPYNGNRIVLWDTSVSAWRMFTFTQLSASLIGMTADENHDVFVYLAGGVPTLSVASAWSSDTTRAVGLAWADGARVLTGVPEYLYVGTIRTSGAGVTEDSAGGTTHQVGGKRFVWNHYNQVQRHIRVIEDTNNWDYLTDAWRIANGATAPLNCVEYVCGHAATVLDATLYGVAAIKQNSVYAAKVAIGLDASLTPVGNVQGGYNQDATYTVYAPLFGSYTGLPGVGYHRVLWLEKGADVFCKFLGDNGGDGQRTGIAAVVLG